jgi:hypothetical protein
MVVELVDKWGGLGEGLGAGVVVPVISDDGSQWVRGQKAWGLTGRNQIAEVLRLRASRRSAQDDTLVAHASCSSPNFGASRG